MMDNVSFLVEGDVAPTALAAAMADVFGVAVESLLMAPRLTYDFDDPGGYAERTLVLYHRYETGDFRLEATVMLGGGRLVVPGHDFRDVFTRLASTLGVSVLTCELREDGGWSRVWPDGRVAAVALWQPDDYDAEGPRLIG